MTLETAAGPEPDYEAIYREFEPKVRALARRRLGGRDMVDDVVQDVFIRAFKALPDLDLERPLWPWLRTVCVNVCTDVLRSPRTWAEEPVGEVPELAHHMDVAAAVVAGEQRRLIADALHELAPRQREILLKRVVDGASTEALAAGDGSTVDAIKSAVKRGRHGFRRAYEHLGAERGLLGGPPLPVRIAQTAMDYLRQIAEVCARACNLDPIWQAVPVVVGALGLLALGLHGVNHRADAGPGSDPSRGPGAVDVRLARFDARAGAEGPPSPAAARSGGGGIPPSAPPGRGKGEGPPPGRTVAGVGIGGMGYESDEDPRWYRIHDLHYVETPVTGRVPVGGSTGFTVYCHTPSTIDRTECAFWESMSSPPTEVVYRD